MKPRRELKILRILMYRTLTDDCKREVFLGVKDYRLSDMFYRRYRAAWSARGGGK